MVTVNKIEIKDLPLKSVDGLTRYSLVKTDKGCFLIKKKIIEELIEKDKGELNEVKGLIETMLNKENK